MSEELETIKIDFYLKLTNEALDGWHVNIRLVGDEVREAVEALDTSHGVTPSAPQRIWL